ncbi:unnamed protein product [Orchesella dallaii]|uniref:Receptor protein-tyrosine kinase n=1 Tax=Orchesella dallaii TaxID=48710 RepID=A0ABP1PUZ4_9HEXA
MKVACISSASSSLSQITYPSIKFTFIFTFHSEFFKNQWSYYTIMEIHIRNKGNQSPLSIALLNSSRGEVNQNPKYSNWSACPFRLYLKVEGGQVIFYKWDKSNESQTIETRIVHTNETVYFENAFRFHSIPKETNCVHLLNETESCSNCLMAEAHNYTINAIIFYAKYQDEIMVFKGMFSVPKNMASERHFYWDWHVKRPVIEEEMIHLNAPQVTYANVPFIVTCRVSMFLFVYGSIITHHLSPDEEEERPKEYLKPFGYREVKRTIVFNTTGDRNVSCFSPLKKSEDWVSKTQMVPTENAIPPSINNLTGNQTELVTVLSHQSLHAECNASGNPIPSLEWKYPMNKNLTGRVRVVAGTNFTRVVFQNWDTDLAGTYECIARNEFGLASKVITFQNMDESEESNVGIIVASSLGTVTLALLITIGVLLWRIRRQRLDFEIQTKKAVEEFKNGLQKDNTQDVEPDQNNMSILYKPYNEAFEVTRSKWDVEDKILGSGQFGIVRMGSVILRGESIKVAVKTLKSTVEIDEFKSFLFELKIMAYLGQHKNIVSLAAACTEEINDRNILIGVEYCDNGCLLTFLKKYGNSFQNLVTKEGKIVHDMSNIETGNQYCNISVMSTRDLYRWSYHIACGMDYLQIKKVLHGDLAARNVLLTSRKVAKVGDFGLSRLLANSENYTKQSQTALPWKWMAVESLKSMVFSFQSDTWSYGITLCELFTLGQTPYPGISWSPDFITQLENGMRMEKPAYCTKSLYKIVRSCWEFEPTQRPNYAQIKRKLSKGLHRLENLIKQQGQNASRNQTQHAASALIVPSSFILSTQENDVGVYTNLPRSTMNYYKNY